MIGQTKNGAVVESLIDGKRFTAFVHERISSLEEISIYTEGEDIPLREVFKKIFELQEGKEALTSKATNDETKGFFAKVLPDYDKERVYVSDIKKVIRWYNMLLEKGLVVFDEEEDKPEAEIDSAEDTAKKDEAPQADPLEEKE
jgi:uncharacterized protein DUF6852/uncharacterized protein DUF5606